MQIQQLVRLLNQQYKCKRYSFSLKRQLVFVQFQAISVQILTKCALTPLVSGALPLLCLRKERDCLQRFLGGGS
jgi:hypothetical protein